MPAGTITATSRAVAGRSGTAENAVRTFSIDPALLRDGRNVLAVEIHQDSAVRRDSTHAGHLDDRRLSDLAAVGVMAGRLCAVLLLAIPFLGGCTTADSIGPASDQWGVPLRG